MGIHYLNDIMANKSFIYNNTTITRKRHAVHVKISHIHNQSKIVAPYIFDIYSKENNL